MKNRVKYFLTGMPAFFILPVIYFHGKKIKRTIPDLPEALEPNGYEKINQSKDALNVVFLGESTFAGVGVQKHSEGFCGEFSKEFARKTNKNISWEVIAKSGLTLQQKREKLLPLLVQSKIDLLIIGTGGNDAFQLSTPWKWRSELKKMVEFLNNKYPATPIAFVNMPPIKDFPAFSREIKFVIGNLSEILGDELDEVVSTYPNVYFSNEKIKIAEWTQRLNIPNEPNRFFSDGVHPSAFTYKTWATDFVNFLLEKEKLKF